MRARVAATPCLAQRAAPPVSQAPLAHTLFLLSLFLLLLLLLLLLLFLVLLLLLLLLVLLSLLLLLTLLLLPLPLFADFFPRTEDMMRLEHYLAGDPQEEEM